VPAIERGGVEVQERMLDPPQIPSEGGVVSAIARDVGEEMQRQRPEEDKGKDCVASQD
jgi:hypothetical protein